MTKVQVGQTFYAVPRDLSSRIWTAHEVTVVSVGRKYFQTELNDKFSLKTLINDHFELYPSKAYYDEICEKKSLWQETKDRWGYSKPPNCSLATLKQAIALLESENQF